MTATDELRRESGGRMSITDELREWTRNHTVNCSDNRIALVAIADRIDAEHERAMAAAALIAGVPMTDENMAEHGWIRLPKDANGEYIHIGDRMDSDHYEDGTVIGVNYFKAPNGVVFEEIAVQPNGWDTATWRDPEEYAHHHAPTVEDMLREFAEKVTDSQIPGVHPTYEEAIAEYAAKLQLREVDE